MPAINHDDMLLRVLKDINDIQTALRRTVANLPLYDIDNENSPAQINTNQNDYTPGNYDVLRLVSGASVSITGISHGVKGRKLRIFNVGIYPITLVHQSGSSAVANRFSFVNASDFIIPSLGNVLLYYDSTQARWVGGDQSSTYDVVNENTPAQITSNQNNYDPGVYEVLRLSTDAARTITGISGGVKGRSLQIFNVGSYAITLAHQSGSSAAANRFKFAIGTNMVILPGSSIRIYYDSTQTKWIEGNQLEESGIAKETTAAQITANQNDYDPSDYNVLRLTSNAAYSITGISGGVKGRHLQIFNVGSYPLTLTNLSGSSLVANRFSFVNASDYIIPPNGNAQLYYDSTQSYWVGGDSASIYDILNETTPAQITSNQNNYDPGVYEVLRLSTDASRTITGISGGVKGRSLQIFNVGSNNLVLAYESGSSSAANRFYSPSAEDTVLYPKSGVRLYYDSTLTRWVIPDAPTWKGKYGISLYMYKASQSTLDDTDTQVTGFTVYADEWGMYNAAGSKIVIPQTGVYMGVLSASFVENAVGYRQISWSVGGSVISAMRVPAIGVGDNLVCSFGYLLTAGDEVKIYALQTSGNTTNVWTVNVMFMRVL